MFNQYPPRYYAYLLRCWQEQRGDHHGSAEWRFSLEDPHTGQRHGFATFEALIAFLWSELEDEWSGTSSVRAGEDLG